MLFLSKTSGPAVFAVDRRADPARRLRRRLPAQSLRSGAIAAVAVIAALGLVAGGVAAALEGERELHPHETTDDLAAEGECDTAEETEADEHASQYGRRQGQHHRRA